MKEMACRVLILQAYEKVIHMINKTITRYTGRDYDLECGYCTEGYCYCDTMRRINTVNADGWVKDGFFKSHKQIVSYYNNYKKIEEYEVYIISDVYIDSYCSKAWTIPASVIDNIEIITSNEIETEMIRFIALEWR